MVDALAPDGANSFKSVIVVGIRTRCFQTCRPVLTDRRCHLQNPCSERTAQIHQDERRAAGSSDIETLLIRDAGGSRTHLSCLLQAAAVPSGMQESNLRRSPLAVPDW